MSNAEVLKLKDVAALLRVGEKTIYFITHNAELPEGMQANCRILNKRALWLGLPSSMSQLVLFDAKKACCIVEQAERFIAVVHQGMGIGDE